MIHIGSEQVGFTGELDKILKRVAKTCTRNAPQTQRDFY